MLFSAIRVCSCRLFLPMELLSVLFMSYVFLYWFVCLYLTICGDINWSCCTKFCFVGLCAWLTKVFPESEGLFLQLTPYFISFRVLAYLGVYHVVLSWLVFGSCTRLMYTVVFRRIFSQRHKLHNAFKL